MRQTVTTAELVRQIISKALPGDVVSGFCIEGEAVQTGDIVLAPGPGIELDQDGPTITIALSAGPTTLDNLLTDSNGDVISDSNGDVLYE